MSLHRAVNAGDHDGCMDRQAILSMYAYEGGAATGVVARRRLQRSWHCARLARNAGASPSLQLAAWLHELGVVLAEADASQAGSSVGAPGADHHSRAATVLAPLFGQGVARPVGLQGQALRCLASSKPAFRKRMSAEALASLEEEGGIQSLNEAREFLQAPFAPQAIRLCLWAVDARDPALSPPSMDAALDSLRRLMWLLQTAPSTRSAGWARGARPGIGRRAAITGPRDRSEALPSIQGQL
jgi:predicted HD phosphohydrolase